MCLLALLWLWLAPALSLGDHRLSPSLTQPRAAAGTAPVCQDRLFHQHKHQSLWASWAGPHTSPRSAQLKGHRAATSNTEGLDWAST